MHGGSHGTTRGPRQAYGKAIGACEGIHDGQVARDGFLGARAARRQRHPRRLQRCALLRGCRGALLLRRHVSDAKPDRRQGGHRVQRLRVSKDEPAPKDLQRRHVMASSAAAVTVETRQSNPPKLDNVLYEKKSGIAYVTLNRPKVLNALNMPTWKDLRTAFEDERVIAAINGFALGGGCETAMACTIRIAVEHAKFGQPEVKLGLLPGGGGTQRLPRLVGKGRALQLILSGETISAQEAYRIGLVNEVVPASDLIPRAEAILKTIASNAPVAVKYALHAVNKGMDTSQSEGFVLEASYFGLCAGTEDKKEGTSAFLEKRAPQFLGR